jgi:hypothetical protein
VPPRRVSGRSKRAGYHAPRRRKLSPEQEAAIRILANELHRVNEAVMNCVQHGLSVELQRVKRVHSEQGYWGDMIVPVIVKQK